MSVKHLIEQLIEIPVLMGPPGKSEIGYYYI